MSIKDFTSAIKSQAYRNWFQRLSTDNILKTSAKDLRGKESSEQFNSFVITKDTIEQILVKLYESDVSPQQVEEVFKQLKSVTYGRNKQAKLLAEPYVRGEALYFPRISFSNISSVLDKGFSKALQDNKSKNISDYFQKGHVFGLFPKKVGELSKSLKTNVTIDPEHKKLLLELLGNLEKHFEAEDLATSNLKTTSFSLYAKYQKKPSSYLVEMQLKEDNEEAGKSQALYSRAIRKFFNPGEVSFKSGDSAGPMQKILEDNLQKLVSSKGSPSYLDLLEEYIANVIRYGKAEEKTYSVSSTFISKSKSAKVDTSEYSKQVKKDKEAVKRLKAKVASLRAGPKIDLPILSRLQPILEGSIRDQVEKNMGTGNSTKVLNYRTGRFADSVKIERLTQSRAGMVTVFYSYMKNPYSTFSEGGRQQYPKSRDPKLLISKSIREIAAKEAYTNLRSVNV